MADTEFYFAPAGEELRGKLPDEECEKVMESLQDPKTREKLSLYFATQMYEFWTEDNDNPPDPFFISTSIAMRALRTFINATEIANTKSWPEHLAPPEFWWNQLKLMERCPLEVPSDTENCVAYRNHRNDVQELIGAEMAEKWGIDD